MHPVAPSAWLLCALLFPRLYLFALPLALLSLSSLSLSLLILVSLRTRGFSSPLPVLSSFLFLFLPYSFVLVSLFPTVSVSFSRVPAPPPASQNAVLLLRRGLLTGARPQSRRGPRSPRLHWRGLVTFRRPRSATVRIQDIWPVFRRLCRRRVWFFALSLFLFSLHPLG